MELAISQAWKGSSPKGSASSNGDMRDICCIFPVSAQNRGSRDAQECAGVTGAGLYAHHTIYYILFCLVYPDLFYSILFCSIILSYFILSYLILCYVMLCYVMFCYIYILYYILLFLFFIII